jgi:signal transduction histidine kinase/ligand-binding sensor domain-containing protein/DNA-binding response OmpR family regulator
MMARMLVRYIILFVITGMYIPLAAQPVYLHKHFGMHDGLSNDEVTSIVQDKQDFIWIGTRGGLNRYDGHEFVSYQKEEGGLSSSAIETLFVDSRGKLWIGTHNGVDCFDPVTESFSHFILKDSNATNAGENRIVQLFEDSKGIIWAGDYSRGLYRKTSDSTFENHVSQLAIRKVIEDDKGLFWIAAEYKGLVLYNPVSQTSTTILDVSTGVTTIEKSIAKDKIYLGTWREGLFEVDISEGYFKSPKIAQHKLNTSIHSTKLNDIYTLRAMPQDELWMGTWDGGLRIWNGEKDIARFARNINRQGLSNNIVLCIFKDRSGLIWVGTDGGGVNIFKANTSGFQNIGADPYAARSLSNEKVDAIAMDTQGNVMVGTRGEGLNIIRGSNVEALNRPGFLDAYYNGKNNIAALLYDGFGNWWIGDLDFGLYRLRCDKDLKNCRYESLRPGEGQHHIGGIKITALAEDAQHRVWVGTQRNGISCISLNANGDIESIHHDNLDIYGEQGQRITTIVASTQSERLWIGTYNGLLNYTTDAIYGRYHQKTKPLLENEIIRTVYEDAKGNVWAGTYNGLWQIRTNASGVKEQKKWTVKDGLSSNYIQGITGVHQDRHLWISTSNGLNMLDLESGTVKIYTEYDGMIGDSFLLNSVFNDKQGHLYFGSTNGLTWFNMDSLRSDRNTIPPRFTGLILNDDINVRVGHEYFGNVILPESMEYTSQIVLDHHVKKFTLTFSAPDFFSPNRAPYSYQLKGYDDRWIEHTSHTASFTNLDAGTYIFRLRVNSNSDQETSAIQEIKITILPPPWATWWAYTGYILFSVLVAVCLFRLINAQTNLRNKLRMEQVLREKESELNQLKLRFFTNISHELRTPLTLIAAPLEEMLLSQTLPEAYREKARLMKRNVKSLLRLSDQLITFRKVETQNMDLLLAPVDVVAFCREIYSLFKLSSGDDKYIFEFYSDREQCIAYIDQEKLEMILLNLISNAVKFSPKGGVISIRVSVQDEYIILLVEDHGIGMSQENVSRIFERFYQLGDSRTNTGVGIGLALVESLVNLHHGQIRVESKKGSGSKFFVSLPLGRWFEKLDYAHMREGEQATLRSDYWKEQIHDLFMEQQASRQSMLESTTQILIVDDNKEMADYLGVLFAGNYRCKIAYNGEDALQVLNNEIIELVILDVMMPGISGVELCQKIKSNRTTSHVPVIMLSAKTAVEDQLSGLHTGADDYIEKPFNPDLLKARVRTRLEKVKELKEYYQREFLLQPKEQVVANDDEKFILDLKSIVEKYIADTDKIKLAVQEEMAMSKATLYRKLKSITDYSLSEFIKVIRIKKAAQLLTSSQLSISEIAYDVGFNDLKYFRVCFESVYHTTPSEYRKANKANTNITV